MFVRLCGVAGLEYASPLLQLSFLQETEIAAAVEDNMVEQFDADYRASGLEFGGSTLKQYAGFGAHRYQLCGC